MVIILVILTFAIVATVHFLLSRRKSAVAVRRTPAPQRSVAVDESMYAHPGHGWVAVRQERLATVGIDEFASRFLGRITRVDLPHVNAVVHQGDPLVTLHRAGGRILTLVAPLSGILSEVNDALAISPDRVNDAPYADGWIARIVPFNLTVELRNLMHGTAADAWREALRVRLMRWFAPRLGTVLQDGGEFVENIGDHLPDKEWQALRSEFFPDVQQMHSL